MIRFSALIRLLISFSVVKGKRGSLFLFEATVEVNSLFLCLKILGNKISVFNLQPHTELEIYIFIFNSLTNHFQSSGVYHF